MHETVLLSETIALLEPAWSGASSPTETVWVVDATVGGGGHTRGVLDRAAHLGVDLRVLALDQDEASLLTCQQELANRSEYVGRVEWVHGRFSDLHRYTSDRPVVGVIADLGYSSLQMDDAARGLSFKREGPLDMRLDPSQGVPLSEKLKSISEEEIATLLRDYGQERYYRGIARSVHQAVHGSGGMTTTHALVLAVVRGVPRSARHGRIHVATRTFQAFRIWINDELGQLDALLAAAARVLEPGGRAAVISFHSLEDRQVKQAFKQPSWEAVTRKPVIPSTAEMKRNPRSRSAKLRVASRALEHPSSTPSSP